MIHRMLVALWSVVLVSLVHGFNPLPAIPLHQTPKTQPQTAPNVVVPPRTLPGRRPSFIQPSTPGQEIAATAALAMEEPQLPGPAAEELGVLENSRRVVAMQADHGSWYGGFAAGIFASFAGISATFLALRSRMPRQALAAPQRDGVQLRQNLFSSQEMLATSSSHPSTYSSGGEPVYTVSSPDLRDALQGQLIANMAHHVNDKGAKKARKNRPRKKGLADINRKPPPYDVEPMIAARLSIPEYTKIGEADMSALTKVERDGKTFYHVKAPFQGV